MHPIGSDRPPWATGEFNIERGTGLKCEMFLIGGTLPLIMYNIGNEIILFGNAGPQRVQSYSQISRVGPDSTFGSEIPF